jgi:hypothetical protein
MQTEIQKLLSQAEQERRERENLLRIAPIPRKETADWVFERLELEFGFLKSQAKQGERVKLECSTGFGPMIVKELSAENGNVLRMILMDSDKRPCIVFATPSQCAFKLSLFIPSPEEQKEIVVSLFTKEQRAITAPPV